MNEPRGLTANNPGNLMENETVTYVGEILPSAYAPLRQFCDAPHGLRAMIQCLRAYQRDGIDTIAGIVTRYAPPSENPTAAYIENVARACAAHPDETIDIERELPQLIRAMVHQEQGSWPYDDATLALAFELAGKVA